MNEDHLKIAVEYITKNTKTWLELLGYPEYNDTVIGNDIVRENGVDEKNHTTYRILWSFENHSQAMNSFIEWNNQFESFCNNPENYKI
jgi:hypothetical protein